MFSSLSEFKFFQTFRIPVTESDGVQCFVEFVDESLKFCRIEDAKIQDISVTGIGFKSKEKLSVDSEIRLSFNFKRLRFDVEGKVVRAFGAHDEEEMLYGVEVDIDDQTHMKRMITQLVESFSVERSRECLTDLALSERYKNASEGFEVFSLMLSLYKDIMIFGKEEGFVHSMLEEVVRILNAKRASIFLINPETNELEATAALGIDKELLKFDYRKGIAGSVFTTGVPLNIDTVTDQVRFSKDIDQKTGFETTSILCYPITNREDKIIGVIEVLNKRNESRFNVDDEKTMKVLTLIFSSIFHNYNPISERSLIRRFSTPYDREFAYIGESKSTSDLRKHILKIKDIDTPLLIEGEYGVGKKLMARIIHNEGKRGLKPYFEIPCRGVTPESFWEKVKGPKNFLEEAMGGSVCFSNIESLPLDMQEELYYILSEKRIPGSKISLDFRPIFTSEKKLEELTQEGKFYRGLYEFTSLSSFEIEPLRHRSVDVESLLNHFLKKECKKQGFLLKEFSDEVKEELLAYDWKGNVNELKLAVERAVLYNPKVHIISKLEKAGNVIVDLKSKTIVGLDSIPYAKDFTLPLKDRVALVEREMILAEIERHKGNKSKAAASMGMSREALRKKLLISDEVLELLNKNKEAKAS